MSLKMTDYGDFGIIMSLEPSPVSMHKQIIEGLEHMTTDYVFMCENDILYHPSHFDFTPPRDDTFYYNTNVWKVRYPDGHAVWTDNLQQVSGLCANRSILLNFYTQRLRQIEREGLNRHYEPGLRQTVGSQRVENWQSAFPNLDIRHGKNITRSKWSPTEFRNKRYARGWKETDEPIPGWGQISGHFEEFLTSL